LSTNLEEREYSSECPLIPFTISSEGHIVLKAVEYLAADQSVTGSAMTLADAVFNRVAGGERVAVDFGGFTGASSSYFNLLIRKLARDDVGAAFVWAPESFRFGNSFQKSVFEQSRAAVLPRRDAP